MFSLVTGFYAAVAVILLVSGHEWQGIASMIVSILLAARWGYVYARDKYE